MKDQHTTTTAEVAAIVQAIHRELGTSYGSATASIQSALQRVSIAVMREEAASHCVTRACNAMVTDQDGQQDLFFLSLLWLDDACEAAIHELLRGAAMWQKIGCDLLTCGGVGGSVMEYQCLVQRRRVTTLALSMMDRQLAVQRQQGRINEDAAGMTQAELQEAMALEQQEQTQEGQR